MSNTNKVWFITGASKGLGLVLAKQALARGYRVAATSRAIDDLTKQLGAATATFLPLAMEVTDEASVKRAVGATLAHFGGLDVVVNNAGYGQLGTPEEATDAEVRQNYDVNVFGALNVMRASLSHLREQRSGHVFNIASIGGSSVASRVGASTARPSSHSPGSPSRCTPTWRRSGSAPPWSIPATSAPSS